MTPFRLLMYVFAFCGALVFATAAVAQEKTTEEKLPSAAKRTFRAKFPKARIEKLEVEKENGVTVYDFEFRDGREEKETDITSDGTMLEWTLVIRERELPKEAAKPIRAAAEGAKMQRVEKIMIDYETKDGKVVKLPKQAIHYAVEMKKGDSTAEITVDDHGKVVEEPKWTKPKTAPKTKQKSAKAKSKPVE